MGTEQWYPPSLFRSKALSDTVTWGGACTPIRHISLGCAHQALPLRSLCSLPIPILCSSSHFCLCQDEWCTWLRSSTYLKGGLQNNISTPIFHQGNTLLLHTIFVHICKYHPGTKRDNWFFFRVIVLGSQFLKKSNKIKRFYCANFKDLCNCKLKRARRHRKTHLLDKITPARTHQLEKQSNNIFTLPHLHSELQSICSTYKAWSQTNESRTNESTGCTEVVV